MRGRGPTHRALGIYHLLWRAYPPDFRRTFEEAAAEVFEARYREERARGRARLVLFWARTVGNVMLHGAAERLASLRVVGTDAVTGLRSARRSARQHVGAILCIAVGLSATTAVLTLVSNTLLRPLPFPEADRLVRVWSVEENVELGGRGHLSYADQVELGAAMTTLEPLVVTGRARVMFLEDGGARRVEGEAVGPGYFDLLGIAPFLGRTFAQDEYRRSSPPTMLLAFTTWMRDYGADPAIVGRTIRTGRGGFTVIGVLPPDFVGTIEEDLPDLEFWIPLEHYLTDAMRTDRSVEFIWTIGRLRPGAALARAHDEAESIGERLIAAGALEAASGFWVEAFGENWRADLRWRNYLLLAAAGLLLLVAATNVAGLLVARGASRQRELAVRAALGASRGRLLRHTLFETLAITMAGGALGATAAPWILRSFLRLAPEQLPGYISLTPDPRSLALAGAVLTVTALGAGLTPALLSARVSPDAVLRAGGRAATEGRASRRTSRWLVIGEVAVTTVLVSSAALLVESYRSMGAVDVGFRSEGVLKVAVFVDELDVPEEGGLPTFYQELRGAVEEVPGVLEVGLASPTVPPAFSSEARARLEGMSEAQRESGVLAYTHRVDPELMRVLDIALIAGRGLERSDNADSSPVAVVSESLAELIGGADAALGRTLDLDGAGFEVVGVSEDVLFLGAAVRRPRDVDVYVPLAQVPSRVVSMAIVAAGDPAALIGPVRARISRLTSRSPLDWIATVPTDLMRGFEGPRFYAVLVLAFAASALVLTAVGIFALLAQKVAGERVEIGIRRACGAQRGHLVGSVLRGGLSLCAAGLGLGVTSAVAVSALLGRTLPGISALDPTGPLAACLVILVTGFVASLAPAWRASRASPLQAMREP